MTKKAHGAMHPPPLVDARACNAPQKVTFAGRRGLEIRFELTPELAKRVDNSNLTSNVVGVLVNGARCDTLSRLKDSNETTQATCLAIVPGESTLRHIERAAELIRSMDVSEYVQVWLATIPPKLLVDQTQNHRHALKMLQRAAAMSSSSAKVPGATIIAVLGTLDRFVDDKKYEESSDLKAFVVVDDDDDVVSAMKSMEGDGRLVDLPRGGLAQLFHLNISAAQTREEIISRRRHLFSAGCCVGVSRSDFRLSFQVDGELQTQYTIPSPDFENIRHMSNSPNCTAPKFPYAEEIVLEFTREQRQTFDDYRAFYKGTFEEMVRSKDDFPLSISFDDGRQMQAKARFRGVSSFRDCEHRKSLSVTLDDGEGVRLSKNSLSNKFLLISMCYDDRYVKTFLVLSMAKKLGLFPYELRYVRLKLRTRGEEEVENLGLYLLMDDPKSSLLRDHNDLAVVVRRRFDPGRATNDPKSIPDVHAHPRTERNDIAARVRYENIVLVSQTCDSEGSKCFVALNELIDIDGYLRWLAMNTWLHCGDYVDELWLHASNEVGNIRFEINAWDPDDAFESCHHGGADALVLATDSESQLLWCAEGAIDRVLLRSPDMWRRYLEQLNYVLREGVTNEEVHQIVIKQATQIRRALNDDATALGLLELREIVPVNTASEAVSQIIGSLNYYESLVNFRRRDLLRNPIAYSVWDANSATNWTTIPHMSSNCTNPVVVKNQTRSYNLPRQEIMFKFQVKNVPFALNISFNPNVLYEGVPYAALPEEFVFEVWSDPLTVPPAPIIVENMARDSTQVIQECTRSFIGRNYAFENYIIVNFSCLPSESEAVFSLHHRFWHSFDVNVTQNMKVNEIFGCSDA